MGKKSRRRVKPAKAATMPFVARTFEGLPGECDWVALREIVPSATATIKIAADAGAGSDRSVRVCSLLPGGGAGLVRPDGDIWLGLQVQHNFGDISRDLAAAVELAMVAEPASEVALLEPPGVGRRLQDLVDPASDFDVTVHEGFDFWVEGADDPTGDLADALGAANEAVAPTVRLSSVEAAYRTDMGERQYLRWVQPHDEERLLTALARLRAAGRDAVTDGTRLIGMFRAHGLLVPVWELDDATSAEALEEPVAAFGSTVDEMLADTSDLTTAERSARNALATRQLTIR